MVLWCLICSGGSSGIKEHLFLVIHQNSDFCFLGHPRGQSRTCIATDPDQRCEKNVVGTDKTLSGPNFGNMGQGFRATMHKVVQEGLSYLTFIVEKSL